MIVAICGGADYARFGHARWVLDYWHARLDITLLVQGGQVSMDHAERELAWEARKRWGADYIAKRWAMLRGIPNAEEPVADADWKKFGEAAAPMRNTRMLLKHKPERLIAFPGGVAVEDMLRQSRAAGIKCIEVA